jgi:hypothetical protein
MTFITYTDIILTFIITYLLYSLISIYCFTISAVTRMEKSSASAAFIPHTNVTVGQDYEQPAGDNEVAAEDEDEDLPAIPYSAPPIYSK